MIRPSTVHGNEYMSVLHIMIKSIVVNSLIRYEGCWWSKFMCNFMRLLIILPDNGNVVVDLVR